MDLSKMSWDEIYRLTAKAAYEAELRREERETDPEWQREFAANNLAHLQDLHELTQGQIAARSRLDNERYTG